MSRNVFTSHYCQTYWRNAFAKPQHQWTWIYHISRRWNTSWMFVMLLQVQIWNTSNRNLICILLNGAWLVTTPKLISEVIGNWSHLFKYPVCACMHVHVKTYRNGGKPSIQHKSQISVFIQCFFFFFWDIQFTIWRLLLQNITCRWILKTEVRTFRGKEWSRNKTCNDKKNTGTRTC